MEAHDEFHWAVAWGTLAEHGKNLIRYQQKFRAVTFGVAFSQTDPNLIDALVGVANAKVVRRFPDGTFHPKVYCFRKADKAAAIVGSANFTLGGLGRNQEAAILIEGGSSEKIFADLFRFVATSAQLGEPITEDFASAYRISCIRANRMRKPPRDPIANVAKEDLRSATSDIVGMSWLEYVSKVRSPGIHNVDGSLELLRIALQWFGSVESFGDLDTPRRKAIAGTLGEYQKTGPELSRDWGWFGSMKGMGDFANRVDQNDRYLAQAIDIIPRHGEVTRPQYEEFAANFLKAFENSARKGSYRTASRLLAMKRPDTFLCVCGPNIDAASETMGFAKSLTLENYWERVVETIRLAEWYNAPQPGNRDRELWNFRAAMLDTILYQP